MGEMPLSVHFFDCLMRDGRSLIDAPYTERWEALRELTGGRHLAEREVVDSREAVLKDKVRGWLVQRSEVLAFVQARASEGGSGALVVLLRPA